MYTDAQLKDSLVSHPRHYIPDRRIEPCEVMETWGLVHHHYLACAFKYLARAGRKKNAVLDLNKALWYLRRFETLKKRHALFLERVDTTLTPQISETIPQTSSFYRWF